ncbi:MAG TPA: diguanylate cyclase [Candidatus Polarisedimenticolaceae bacterium]|nr:diguanylate cyclase [Candidatus Polarisedimenticolaceae bacterium]
MSVRVLVLGPVSDDVRAALAALPGGAEIVATPDAHAALAVLAAAPPDLLVEGEHALGAALSASAFKGALAIEFARAMRYRHPLSLLVVGIDRETGIVSSHGEGSVHRLRESLSAMLRRSLRQIDLLAPLGSAELAVLLPETAASGARSVAERIRALAARVIVKSAPGGGRPSLPVKASVTVGVCDAPRDGVTTPEAFLETARAARRLGEDAGGDRTEVVTG